MIARQLATIVEWDLVRELNELNLRTKTPVALNPGSKEVAKRICIVEYVMLIIAITIRGEKDEDHYHYPTIFTIPTYPSNFHLRKFRHRPYSPNQDRIQRSEQQIVRQHARRAVNWKSSELER
jgi:hypothetical protein